MASASDFRPSVLKPSQSKGGLQQALKESFTLEGYSGGAPQTGELKPSLLDSLGNLKSSLLSGGSLKESLTGVNSLRPVASTSPAVSGVRNVGQTLTSSQGSWTNSPSSYAYQWQRDGVDIAGETTSTYTLANDDLSARVRCCVTATNSEGEGVAYTAGRIVAWSGIGRMKIGSTNVVGLTDHKIVQKSASSGGTWGPMDGSSILFLDDTAYLIGGWAGASYNDDWASGTTTNLVYKSTNFGVSWTKVRDHDLTPDATHFSPRHTFNSFVHNVGGTDYMYIIGGDPFDTTTDVRRSTDGITWTKINSGTLPFDGVFLTSAGVLSGDIYVVGGTTTLEPAGHNNNVWKSTDDGVTFSLVGTAPWTKRSTVDRLVPFDSKLWLISGGQYSATPSSRVYFNDVWSFDGTTWTEVLADGHSQFSGVQYPNCFAFDGWMYLYKGYNLNVGGNINNVYRSRDGSNWQAVENSLLASHADGVGVHADGVLFASGNGWLTGSPTNSDSPSDFLTFK